MDLCNFRMNRASAARLKNQRAIDRAIRGTVEALGARQLLSTATFIKVDLATAGEWQSAYGSDGYALLGDQANYPAYVQASNDGGSYTWDASTNDPRALQKPAPATDRVASTLYSTSSSGVSIDLQFTDAQIHQVDAYMTDYDGLGRTQRVEVLDRDNSDAILDTRMVSDFAGGQHLSWNVDGHVALRFVPVDGVNAIVSGVFFDPEGEVPEPAVTSATFVHRDRTSGGDWQGTYGAEGYALLGSTLAYPSYVQASHDGGTYTWDASTADPRALQKPAPATDRVASTLYSTSSAGVSVDLNFTDALVHQVDAYMVDYDALGRTQRVDVLDPASGDAVLDSRAVSDFTDGQHLTWDLSGHVVLRFVPVEGVNALVSGLFFHAQGTLPAAPQDVVATRADDGTGPVTLSWSAVSGATGGYSVYRGSTAGGQDATPLATGVTLTEFTDTTAEDGIDYFYTVTATGGGGGSMESGQSAQAASNPLAELGTVTPETRARVTSWFGGSQDVSFPVGRYLVEYLSGAINYHTPTNLQWSTNGHMVTDDQAASADVALPDSGDHNSAAAASAASAGFFVSIDHTFAGPIGVYLQDDPYDDNSTPGVTWRLTMEPVPVVTISASDGDADESGLNPGEFMVHRSGSTSTSLTVNLKPPVGTAIEGTDFQTLPRSVVISPGQSTVKFAFTPIDDPMAEGIETAKLAVLAHPSYVVNEAIFGIIKLDDDINVTAITVKGVLPAFNRFNGFSFNVQYDLIGEHLDKVDIQQLINSSTTLTDYTGHDLSETELFAYFPAGVNRNGLSTGGEFNVDGSRWSWARVHVVPNTENGKGREFDLQSLVLKQGEEANYTPAQITRVNWLADSTRYYRVQTRKRDTGAPLMDYEWGYKWNNYGSYWGADSTPVSPKTKSAAEIVKKKGTFSDILNIPTIAALNN